MKNSVCMDEILRIRDTNSQRYMTISREEISAEFKQSTNWFLAKMEKSKNTKPEQKN